MPMPSPRAAARVVGLATLAATPAVNGQPLTDGIPQPRSSLLQTDATPPLALDDHVGCGKACRLHAMAAAGLLPPVPIGDRGPGPGDPTDLLHNTLDIEVFPGVNTQISGRNAMLIRSNADGLTTFTFRLRGNFAVTACTVTDALGTYAVTPTTPPADNSSYGRTVTLARPVNAGQTFTLTVTYSGAAVSRGFGSIEFTTQNGAGTPPVIASLSEPYYAATWMPCKDGDVLTPGDNSDKSTWDIAVTAPSQFRSVANGTLAGVDALPGGRSRYRWSCASPMSTYLAAFCTTQYNTYTRSFVHPGGTMPVEFNLYTTSDSPAQRSNADRIVTMLGTLGSVYGPYPFIAEKYGVYQFPFSGGMEHQTNSGQIDFSESLSAHELAHQWWGDHITCKTWNDIWLNEGFATYAEALWFERKPGSAGLPALKSAMANRRPLDPVGNLDVDGTVYCPSADLQRIFSSNYSYRKGAWVLHTLRHVIGDQAFFDTLAAYRAAFGGSVATTADFAAVATAVSGRDLSPFFAQWVHSRGAPIYQYGWRTDTIAGRPYLRLNIRQVQQATHPAWPIFTLPIDVRVDTPAGPRTAVVTSDAAGEHFLIALPAAATAVTLDPDDWILTAGKTQTAYTPGPPVIVAATPEPGASLTTGGPAAIDLVFSDNVTIAPSNVAVTRDGVTPVSFTLAYDPATFTSTLAFAAPLAPGAYAVTVSDAVRSAAGAIPLDGELDAGGALPTGDGLPGGMMLLTFTVAGAPPCRADFDASGSADVSDIFAFLSAWFGQVPAANINADAAIDVADIFAFLSLWFAGC